MNRLTRTPRILRALSAAMLLALCCGFARASENHGAVLFGGQPVPGALVTATQGDKKFTAITDAKGLYSFADLPDGSYKIEVSLSFFSPISQQITVGPDTPGIAWELKMLPLAEAVAQAKAIKPEPVVVAAATTPATPGASAAKPGAKAAKPADNTPQPDAPKPSDESAQSNDGFLVNGSVNNAATSQFSLAQAFGNQRRTTKSLYTGGLSLIMDNSALDARAFSLTGTPFAKPAYNNVTLAASLGGPINIPHLMPRGPNFFVVYQWTRDQTANNDTGLVPTAQQRVTTNPQALALLKLYPDADTSIPANLGYNYQRNVLNSTHQDALQLRMDKTIGRKDSIFGNFAFQNTRSDNSNLFAFRDTSAVLGLNSNLNWTHRFSQRFFLNLGYRTSRLRTLNTPYFATHTFAGNSLFNGKSTDPRDQGPPSLN